MMAKDMIFVLYDFFKQATLQTYVYIKERRKSIPQIISMLIEANKKFPPKIEILLAYFKASSTLTILCH